MIKTTKVSSHLARVSFCFTSASSSLRLKEAAVHAFVVARTEKVICQIMNWPLKLPAWKWHCIRVGKTTPKVQWFARRTHRTQHIVLLTAMIYYSQSIQKKAKGKSVWVKTQRKPDANFDEPSPRRVTQDALIPPSRSVWHIWIILYQENIWLQGDRIEKNHSSLCPGAEPEITDGKKTMIKHYNIS